MKELSTGNDMWRSNLFAENAIYFKILQKR